MIVQNEISFANVNYKNYTTNKNKQEVSFENELSSQKIKVSDMSITVSKTEESEPKKFFYGVLTYENTKGMTPEDVNKYFPDKSEEEKERINYLISLSEGFSESDAANKAIYEEAGTKITSDDRLQFSIEMTIEKQAFMLGEPRISNVLKVNPGYFEAAKRGLVPELFGIYLNATHEAIHKSGNLVFSYGEEKFTESQADEYIETMYKLSKQRMEESKGSQVFDDYKEAFERYENIYTNYQKNLKGQEIDV